MVLLCGSFFFPPLFLFSFLLLPIFIPELVLFNTFVSSGAGRQPVSVVQPSQSGADMQRAGWQFASILKTKMELKAAFPPFAWRNQGILQKTIQLY